MRLFILLFILPLSHLSFAQNNAAVKYWHDKERSIHYKPQGNDFVCVNGKMRFNRALYGGNTAFRVEAGDLPEFALYMPGMGGNLKLGLIVDEKSKWLSDAQNIEARYRAGSMIYTVKDPLLQSGYLSITVLSLYDREGIIVKVEAKDISGNVKLFAAFGGATGTKFSRDGDIGADPESSFYLKPEYCKDNIYQLDKNTFSLHYGFSKALTDEERYEVQHLQGQKKDTTNGTATFKTLVGIFPLTAQLKLSDAGMQQSPLQFFSSSVSSAPAVTTAVSFTANEPLYFMVQNPKGNDVVSYSSLPAVFNKAEKTRKELAGRVSINTPDPYINTLGGALSIAADAIWEDPSYMHGAVAWRMRLNGWRGAYVADVLGWHDRARKHFSSYARSQVTTPVTGPVVSDTALHLARQQEKLGTSLFSSGYISRNPNGDLRAHHYDMNLVFIDQLLNHFLWTGDIVYVKEMWPLLTRHLDWEKRNFDADGDGLYDAYAAIWASDAMQYSGGGVTHSSAYNYRANKMAAELAKLINEDGTIYEAEANKIYTAINKNLWLPTGGWYAEYKDLLGNKLVHPSAGLWTIYHAIDSKVPDNFQMYQSLRYVDNYIPHIPVKANGLNEKDLYLLSTTNWQPYTWSLNNVVLAENLHTALAYWQGNRSEAAFLLWRSAILESMYLSASPGGFEQLSFYDAIRGELYRDFADPIGMTGRSLVEGLFGIRPDALHDTLTIQPGFPSKWNYANLQTQDINFDFKRNGDADTYVIKPFFKNDLYLKLLISVPKDEIASVNVNGKAIQWNIVTSSVDKPLLQINVAKEKQYQVVIKYKGKPIAVNNRGYGFESGAKVHISLPGMKILSVYDPQGTMDKITFKGNDLAATAKDKNGRQTIFIKVEQGIFSWWWPGDLFFIEPVHDLAMKLVTQKNKMEKVDLQNYFNDKVNNIFKHQYLSPRPAVPTLQLPTQGIGNWAYPLATANINDSGLRKLAGTNNEIKDSAGIPFATASDTSLNNILFTSQWDNFPHAATIPLSGKASQIHLLMAGSTNPMQSRITNGMVVITYTDRTGDTLLLKNPQNWWPIEQDYYVDGYAFTTNADIPERFYLKEGKFARGLPAYSTIRGFSNRGIDGGAATVLNMFLDKNKTLKSLTVAAVANDVVIGLMAATLIR